MSKDPFHSIKRVRAIAPQSLGATGSGGKVSKIIDRQGYDGPVVFANEFGTITATNATVAVNVKDGDATSALSNVTAALLLGTLAAAGIGATAARADDVSKNVCKSVAYIGPKRYVEVTMAPTVCGGIIASSTAELHGARTLPAA